MLKLVARLSLLTVAMSVFPGCLEIALIQALDKRGEPDDVAVPEAYDDSWDTSDPVYDEEVFNDPSYYESSVDIRSSSLAGDMGEVRNFWDDDPMHLGYDYGSYASIEIHAQTPGGSAAMAILQVEGGLQHQDLVPGAHLEFTGYSYQGTANGLYMSVIGCSGPSEGNWYFDQSADDLVVDVSATPEGTTVLDFQAEFSGQTVVGSAELGPLQAQ